MFPESSSLQVSKISLENLLNDVNKTNNFKNDLPLDVYYKFNDSYKSKAQDSRGLLFNDTDIDEEYSDESSKRHVIRSMTMKDAERLINQTFKT